MASFGADLKVGLAALQRLNFQVASQRPLNGERNDLPRRDFQLSYYINSISAFPKTPLVKCLPGYNIYVVGISVYNVLADANAYLLSLPNDPQYNGSSPVAQSSLIWQAEVGPSLAVGAIPINVLRQSKPYVLDTNIDLYLIATTGSGSTIVLNIDGYQMQNPSYQ